MKIDYKIIFLENIWNLFKNKKIVFFWFCKNTQTQKNSRTFLFVHSFFQFHIQLFLNYFTLVNRETMMYYAKEFRILQLRRIITRWCCRIIQVLRLFNSVLFGTRSYKFFVSNFNFFADLIIQQLKL